MELLLSTRMLLVLTTLAMVTTGALGANYDRFTNENIENLRQLSGRDDAHWSAWEPWGECSRTCGGGVSQARRHCIGSNCKDEKSTLETRYRVCKSQPCPEPVSDYRSQQCAFYNAIPHQGLLYEWIPDDQHRHRRPCSLFCRARNADVSAMMSLKVLDGTRCHDGSNDVCINGTCQEVGCDGKLNSNAKLDVCGKCEGGGSTCRLVTGLYRPNPHKRHGAEVVITIPQNSRHVSISERGSGHAGLKLNNSESEFLVPGKIFNSTWKVFQTSGLVVQRGSLSYGKEYFDVPGPVPSDLKIVAVYDEQEWKYIRYEFYRPLKFVWKHDASTSKCTATCGSGLQYIRPICVDLVTGDRQSEAKCKQEGLIAPAPRVLRCNVKECPDSLDQGRLTYEYDHRGSRLKWLTDPWTICSKSCAGGFQTRTLSCAEETFTGEVHLTVDETPCLNARVKKPESKRGCKEEPCPHWRAMDWSRCSERCGRGWQHRVVRCQTHDDRAAFGCATQAKPIVRKSCFTGQVCPARALPEAAVLAKPVRVSREKKKSVLAEAKAIRVEEVRSISTTPSWMSDSWGDCSATCGRGVTSRLVRCMVMLEFTGRMEVLPDSECFETKPATGQPCSMGACEPSRNEVVSEYYDPDYVDNDVIIESLDDVIQESQPAFVDLQPHNFEWRYVEGSCTTSCGNGTKPMIQRCFHITNNSLVSSELCDKNLRITEMTRPCNAHPCPATQFTTNGTGWHISPYQECNVTCGRGIQNRTVVCQRRPEGIDNDDVTESLGEPMPDLMCPAPKPQNQRICSQTACDPVWVGLRWGKCSRYCGRGVQERNVVCRQKLGTGNMVDVNAQFCPRKRPQTKRPCTVRACPPRYFVKKWPPCRRTCGKEVVTRTVKCGRVQPGNPFPVIINPKYCARMRRPPSKKNCNLPKCMANIVQATEPFNQTSRVPKVRFNIGSGAIVFSGTIVVIRCKVQKYWRNQIQWLYQGEPVDFDDDRYQLVPDGSLRIHKVALQDSGAYTCLVGSSRADSLVLVTPDPEEITDLNSLPNVTADPDGIDVVVPPLVSLAPQEEPIPVFNDQISFLSFINEMNDTPNERVHSSPFTKLGDIYETESPNYLPELDGDINDVVNAFQQRSTGDSVVFVSRLNHSAVLPVIHSPPTTSPLQSGRDVTAYVGGNLIVGAAVSVTIFCEAEGNPFPVITWYREDRRLPEHLKRQYILADGSLRIYNPEVGDSGSYTCVASNPHGNATATTSLSVTLAPRILSTTEPLIDLTSPVVEVTVGSSITAKLGSKVLIRCPTMAHPKAYVVWLKDSPGLRQNARTLHDNTLEINPTTEADQGLFGCEATNPSGSDYQASSLTLIDPPHISDSLNETPMMGNLPELLLTSPVTETYRVKAYSSVMMGCPVTGFPEPSIEWTFNGVPLIELGRTLDYQLMRQDQILQIPDANMDTEGLYQCTARNEGGNFTTSLRLGLIEYSYEFGDFTQCSTTCGSRGTRHRRLVCIEDRNKEVDEWFCTGLAKPVFVMEPCNQVDCPPHFVTGPWGDCSVTCGDGVRTRETPCVVVMSDGSTREVAAEECLSQHTQPNNTLECHAGECPVWKAGPWRRCSKKCAGKGVGRRTRRIFCVSGNGTINEPKQACKGQPKPTRKELCPNSKCEPLWVISHWSVCSQSCGKSGIKTRILHCVFGGRRRQSAGKLCPKRSRPNVSGPCNRFPCKQGARITPPRLPPAGVPCINRSRKCPLIKRIGLCPKYRHLCCRICR